MYNNTTRRNHILSKVSGISYLTKNQIIIVAKFEEKGQI